MTMAEGVKQCAANRKAWHDYFIEDKLEAGIELFGTEVKSIRGGKCNLKDSYVEIKDGEAFIQGMHISPYDHGNIFNKAPRNCCFIRRRSVNSTRRSCRRVIPSCRCRST